MGGRELVAAAGAPMLIRSVCEYLARGFSEEKITRLVIQDFGLDRELAKAIFDRAQAHLRSEGLDRDHERGLALVRLSFLYRSLVENRDYKAAHSVVQTQIDMLRLDEINPALREADREAREKSIEMRRKIDEKANELTEAVRKLRGEASEIKRVTDEMRAEAEKRRASADGRDIGVKKDVEQKQEVTKGSGKTQRG